MLVHDLFRHTAGLAYGEVTPNAVVKDAYAQAGLFKPGAIDFDTRDLTPAEFTERLAKQPLVGQPGQMWQYSLATDLLGRVVEAVSGQRLSAFLDQRVFKPLAMNDTAFHVPAEKMARLAQPFATDPASSTPINLLDVTVAQKNDAGGAGSVGTASDYARFLQMLLNGGELDGVRLLSPTTVRYMTADHLSPETKFSGVTTLPGGTGFGLGFAVRNETGRFEVTGSAGEYYWAGAAGTGFYVDPKEEIVVVWMTQAPFGMPRRYDRYLFKQMVYQAVVK